MKKISKWALGTGIIGLAIALGGYYRYFVKWDDPSQGIIFICIGILFMLWAYDYNTELELRVEQDSIAEALHEHINRE